MGHQLWCEEKGIDVRVKMILSKEYRESFREHFNSLCRDEKREKRTCLKCRVVFPTSGRGHRICGVCAQRIRNAPKMCFSEIR